MRTAELLDLIEALVKWDNTNDTQIISAAGDEDALNFNL